MRARLIGLACVGLIGWSVSEDAALGSPQPAAETAGPAIAWRVSPGGGQVPAMSGDAGEKLTRASDRQAAPVSPVIVIGFVGGFVGHSNTVHSPVQLAARLRGDYPSGLYVEVFENHRREDAHRKILQLLSTGHSGNPSEKEKRDARIIIYGMSWGGSETVGLARELEAQNIPVLLTIQVDSVGKWGENDGLIPVNVAEAVNFYQDNGLVHGRAKIQAEDEQRTRILGNFRYDYKAKPVTCKGYPWWDRKLMKYHTQIECDPAVWNRVEAMIQEKLARGEGKNGADAERKPE